MRYDPIRFAFALFVTLPIANPAAGATDTPLYEAKFGMLAHDVDDLWSNFSREEGVNLNAEVSFDRSLRVWVGEIRPAIGISLNTAGDTSKAYIDARWEFAPTDQLSLAIGAGAAIHDGDLDLESRDRKALGSRVLFHFPAEIGWRFDDHHGVSVFFDHVSNAWLADANEGMDTLGIRYGYRF